LLGETLETKKLPIDPCGRCGCQRKHHNPPTSYTKSKFRIHGMVGTWNDMIKVQAPTCCDSCPHCFCFCIAFVEPFPGQPFTRCHYENEDYTHNDHYDPTASNSITIPSVGSRDKPPILEPRRMAKAQKGRKITAPKSKRRPTGGLF
jgi:hypothetical protein